MAGTFRLFGDFDECLSIGEVKNQGHTFSPHSCYLGIWTKDAQMLIDPDKQPFTPYLLSFSVSVCAPNTCSEQDLVSIANSALNPVGLGIRPGVHYCQKNWYDVPLSDWAIAAM